MTDTQLLAWGRQELDQQMTEDAAEAQICHRCGRNASEMGFARWSYCTFCGRPVCDRCAVQAYDGHFCPTCPRTSPF